MPGRKKSLDRAGRYGEDIIMDDPVSPRRRRPVRKALIIATVVGPLLTLINQWEAVIGDGTLVLWKALLTFVVPFCVSLISSYEIR